MINKNKILKAIQNGIKSGFKFSPDNIVDDSSYINFDDSKVDGIESLNIDQINRNFQKFVDKKDYINAKKYIVQYGIDILKNSENYNKSIKDLFNILKDNDISIFYPFNSDELYNIINIFIKYGGNEVDLNWIDVSNITDMSCIFKKSQFNGDISEWNVSNVTNMSYMFAYSQFKGNISKWNVSNVKDMSNLFLNSQFNEDISQWNVSNVTNMSYMFWNSKFNGNISNWNVSKVTNMESMFITSKFNGDISNWNVKNVRNMRKMFQASIFNGNISDWNVKNVRNMECMFNESIFNNDISKWNISNVEKMYGMLKDCNIEKEKLPLGIDYEQCYK